MASGFWFNIGGETSVSLSLNEDGTLSLTAGTPDIGGLRASLCMPFGLQVIGKFRGDVELLNAAEAIEHAFSGIAELRRPRPDLAKLRGITTAALKAIVTHPPHLPTH